VSTISETRTRRGLNKGVWEQETRRWDIRSTWQTQTKINIIETWNHKNTEAARADPWQWTMNQEVHYGTFYPQCPFIHKTSYTTEGKQLWSPFTFIVWREKKHLGHSAKCLLLAEIQYAFKQNQRKCHNDCYTTMFVFLFNNSLNKNKSSKMCRSGVWDTGIDEIKAEELVEDIWLRKGIHGTYLQQ